MMLAFKKEDLIINNGNRTEWSHTSDNKIEYQVYHVFITSMITDRIG